PHLRAVPATSSLPLHDALPISRLRGRPFDVRCLLHKGGGNRWRVVGMAARVAAPGRVLTHVPRGGERLKLGLALSQAFPPEVRRDRKSTRLNSSHVKISYAVFC